MRALYVGKDRSMKYRTDRVYVLAVTYHKGLFWIADINGKGKPTPYSSISSFKNYWVILEHETTQ